LPKNRRRILILLALGVCALIVLRLPLQKLAEIWQKVLLPGISFYQNWLDSIGQSFIFLPFLAFCGGIIVSISPCILSLLPVNLSYIGTLEPKSKKEALINALFFVCGASCLFAIVGSVAGLANALLVEWRYQVYLVMGLVICLTGIKQLGLLPDFSLPRPRALGWLGHPFWVGFSFATILSPCASSISIGTLLAAGGTGSPVWGAFVMICYGFGYTLIIFLASVGVGFAKQARKLIAHADRVLDYAGIVLTVSGLFYIYLGATGLIFPKPSESGIE